MTVFGPRCLLKVSKSLPRAPRSLPRASQEPSHSPEEAFHSLQESPIKPPREFQEPALQTFLHSLIEEKTSKDHNTIGLWIKMAFALSTLSLPILDIQRGCSQGRVSHVMTRPIFRVSLRTTWEATRFNLHTPIVSKGDGS